MINKITRFLYGDVPFSCESMFSINESIERLKNSTKQSVFQSFTKENAVGIVTKNKIKLQRVIPFVGNTFKPIFIGKFIVDDNKVIIDGRFTSFTFAKVFMTFWFGFFVLLTLSDTIKLIKKIIYDSTYFQTGSLIESLPLTGVGFLVFGVLFIKWAWMLSSGDIDYLKKVISDSVSGASNKIK